MKNLKLKRSGWSPSILTFLILSLIHFLSILVVARQYLRHMYYLSKMWIPCDMRNKPEWLRLLEFLAFERISNLPWALRCFSSQYESRPFCWAYPNEFCQFGRKKTNSFNDVLSEQFSSNPFWFLRNWQSWTKNEVQTRNEEEFLSSAPACMKTAKFGLLNGRRGRGKRGFWSILDSWMIIFFHASRVKELFLSFYGLFVDLWTLSIDQFSLFLLNFLFFRECRISLPRFEPAIAAYRILNVMINP